MQTIPIEQCQKIGYIRKTHGVHGEVVLEYDRIYEPSIDVLNRFFIELEGLLVPFFMKEEAFRYKTNQSAIVLFDTVVDEYYAKRLVGKSVYIFKNEVIVDESAEPQTHQLMDYVLQSNNGKKIGAIKNVDDFAGNIVLTVDYNDNELLVPFHDDFVVQIDHQRKTITYKLTEGIISN